MFIIFKVLSGCPSALPSSSHSSMISVAIFIISSLVTGLEGSLVPFKKFSIYSINVSLGSNVTLLPKIVSYWKLNTMHSTVYLIYCKYLKRMHL